MEYREGYYIENNQVQENYYDESNDIYGYLLVGSIFSLCMFAMLHSRIPVPTNEDQMRTLNSALINNIIINDLTKNKKKYETFDSKYNDEECIICLEKYNKSDNIIELKCNHYYHSSCILDWFKSDDHLTCPLCRYESYII